MALATSGSKNGIKRICASCSARFFDLNKRPILCPNCNAEFVLDLKTRARRARAAAAEETNDADLKRGVKSVPGVDDDTETDAAVISLDDVDDGSDDDAEEVVEADLDIDDLDDDDNDDDDDIDVDDDDEDV